MKPIYKKYLIYQIFFVSVKKKQTNKTPWKQKSTVVLKLMNAN